ncbi:hypothetical protein [Microtetraspora malaysiensis]|uniref:Uncharacterized protein n=1 Tax=Microtetraspora malaysiensis TaxID=161358 RepID=A0ABW6T5A9_9ACTN
MAVALQRESTEYLYLGITGGPPSVGAEFALLAAGQRPDSGDWKTAVVVSGQAHALWADAKGSGVKGDYYIGCLVGAFGGNTVAPPPGDYQVWLRLTDTTEQPVRIAPIALEIA